MLNEKGFSLIELMIVIIIIGILATLAVPRYKNITRKAKEAEAKIMLNQVYSLQESFFYENDRYATDISELEFEQEKLINEGGRARYLVKIEKADTATFLITATSVVDYDKDGIFSVWQIDEKGLILNSTKD